MKVFTDIALDVLLASFERIKLLPRILVRALKSCKIHFVLVDRNCLAFIRHQSSKLPLLEISRLKDEFGWGPDSAPLFSLVQPLDARAGAQCVRWNLITQVKQSAYTLIHIYSKGRGWQ
jgi:hypothetical protein